jgi:GTPase SAR1 family protein
MEHIINFDFLVKNKKKYRNPNKLTLQHPSRVIVFGPSGSGKTTTIANLLLNPKTRMEYDRVYLFAKLIDEALYEAIIERFEKVEAKLSAKLKQEVKILYYSNSLDDVPPLDSIDSSIQNLFIFDDFLCDENRDKIIPYWIMGRKKNISVFFLAQSFYNIDKDMRGNSNYLILYKLNNYSDLRRIYNDSIHGIEWEDFKKVYDATIRQDIHGFVTVSNNETDLSRRVRPGII